MVIFVVVFGEVVKDISFVFEKLEECYDIFVGLVNGVKEGVGVIIVYDEYFIFDCIGFKFKLMNGSSERIDDVIVV